MIDRKKSEIKKQLEYAIDDVIKNGYRIFDRAKYIRQRLSEVENICLYGTGGFYKDYSYTLENYNYVCDKNPNKWGTMVDGRICLSPKQLAELSSVVVIVTVGDYRTVQKELDDMKIENYFLGDIFLNIYDEKYSAEKFMEWKSQMIDTIDVFADDISKEVYVNTICNRIAPQYAKKTFHDMEQSGEYFDTGLLEINDNESFVDVGAFDGDSIVKFLRKTNGKYNKIYAFELDPFNYEKLCKDFSTHNYKNMNVYNYGISNKSNKIKIVQSGTGSRIDNNGQVEVELLPLDEIIHNEITFLKMDIEGEEIKGIEGAKELIAKYKPKLAISVYHKLNHLWEIPLMLKKMCPQYKFYLRHHTAIVWDTDCYACISEGDEMDV